MIPRARPTRFKIEKPGRRLKIKNERDRRKIVEKAKSHNKMLRKDTIVGGDLTTR